MPKLAAFPKAYLDALVIDGSMSLIEWIDLASQLDIEGLELYADMIDLKAPARWSEYRNRATDKGLTIPMLCCSPDFTHPDPTFRQRQIDLEKTWIDMTAQLGGTHCRVLSGQRRPQLTHDTGIQYAAECIIACHDHAKAQGVTLILENHYKDNYWQYPEFAQHTDVFCALIDAIDVKQHSHFGVNFDPSNTLLAGEDPLDLLERVKHHVVSMHASDRYLAHGTLADLHREEGAIGYAKRLQHGEIGKGMNDYDAIFTTLQGVHFDGWISIEDGIDGFEQLKRSVAFLNQKIAQYWPPVMSE